MKVLSMDELEELVPAAFADSPALDRVSERYSFIPTRPLIDQIIEHGWMPVEAKQSGRVADPLHTTHMITFRQVSMELRIGDVLPQISLTNNHMGLHRYGLLAGFFKLLCSNGLVVSVGGVPNTQSRLIHKDGANVQVEPALIAAILQLDEAGAQVAHWLNCELDFGQRQDFAAKAICIKNHNDPIWSRHFDAHEFLAPRRTEDKKNDLWSVFNVVQENIMKGGVQGAVRNTRPITQVAEIQRINTELWQLADQFGQQFGVN